MLVSTTANLEGYRISEYIGIVQGLTVRAATLGQGIRSGFKNIVGGEVDVYIEVCEAAREQAYKKLLKQAKRLKANAIVGLRYDSTSIGAQAEVHCYGTAVIVEKI